MSHIDIPPGDYEKMEGAMVEVFDSVKGIPRDVQTIVALIAFGLSDTEIAKRLSVTTGRVSQVRTGYEYGQIAEKGDALRKMLLSCIFERVAYETLAAISEEDWKNLTLKERVQVAAQCAKASEALGVKPVKPRQDEDDVLAKLKMIDVEDDDE